ncbi:MAG TPA: hypothetical protein PKC76_00165 [Saprospiraceae bacterium]|nr:hypothetical protein [Saprospiraceae bacterium]HMP22506.1 hypothetical protein [Saprospiraceae bacterium]
MKRKNKNIAHEKQNRISFYPHCQVVSTAKTFKISNLEQRTFHRAVGENSVIWSALCTSAKNARSAHLHLWIKYHFYHTLPAGSDMILSNLNIREQKTYPVHILLTDCGYV